MTVRKFQEGGREDCGEDRIARGKKRATNGDGARNFFADKFFHISALVNASYVIFLATRSHSKEEGFVQACLPRGGEFHTNTPGQDKLYFSLSGRTCLWILLNARLAPLFTTPQAAYLKWKSHVPCNIHFSGAQTSNSVGFSIQLMKKVDSPENEPT